VREIWFISVIIIQIFYSPRDGSIDRNRQYKNTLLALFEFSYRLRVNQNLPVWLEASTWQLVLVTLCLHGAKLTPAIFWNSYIPYLLQVGRQIKQ